MIFRITNRLSVLLIITWLIGSKARFSNPMIRYRISIHKNPKNKYEFCFVRINKNFIGINKNRLLMRV